MSEIPKPKTSKSGVIQGPKLTETDFLEIGGKFANQWNLV
jgi:hypothetical protein